jgi:hypothetical protein
LKRLLINVIVLDLINTLFIQIDKWAHSITQEKSAQRFESKIFIHFMSACFTYFYQKSIQTHYQIVAQFDSYTGI